MSGAGPAIQSDGSIWVVTGNGDFDGKVDFSESVVRLRYTPAAGNTKASLKVDRLVDALDRRRANRRQARGREDVAAAAAAFLKSLPEASNFRRLQAIARAGVEMTNGDWGDQDLGASGIVLHREAGDRPGVEQGLASSTPSSSRKPR